MYRVIVHVNIEERVESFEFLEQSRDDAYRCAEEVAQSGFWVGQSGADRFISPPSIDRIEVLAPPDQRTAKL